MSRDSHFPSFVWAGIKFCKNMNNPVLYYFVEGKAAGFNG